MSQIFVNKLTFAYDGSYDTIFENASFNLDTSWKLGLIGRNGKGKTTLLKLLMDEYEYTGTISTHTCFDLFPYPLDEGDLDKTAAELAEKWKPWVELWQILIQMNLIKIEEECLFRPFGTLSHGERTRVMLGVLFAAENDFLLIDEPTNHLDQEARACVRDFLSMKNGFILVSHDRDLLDAVVDHVLVLNRKTIEMQTGNFSSWQENKERADAHATAENAKHMKEIKKLKNAADRSGRWADKNEGTKIGFDPKKEPDRNISTRSYIGAKTKKMQARVKSYEKRIDREIEEKEGLLQDIERMTDLKLHPVSFHKDVLVRAKDLSLGYDEMLISNLSFELKQGDRLVLSGKNGCGKSTLIKSIIKKAGRVSEDNGDDLRLEGELSVPSGLLVSYVNQDTSFLHGTIKGYCKDAGLDETLFFTALRQLGFERTQFIKDIEDFSEGQKKKVLVAASLITPAHLYIWDEPLNYMDVFSRMQVEELILKYRPTMLLVEHDVRFHEKVATGVIRLDDPC